MPIYFHNEDYIFLPKNQFKIKKWIKLVISGYKKDTGDINFIFTSDRQILSINKIYLGHDYYTDIISFDYSADSLINGDIFISVERVVENATTFQVSFNQELKRVIVHGILHFIGFKDNTENEKAEMRTAEDLALSTIEALLIV